jgi:hypothetical protein
VLPNVFQFTLEVRLGMRRDLKTAPRMWASIQLAGVRA